MTLFLEDLRSQITNQQRTILTTIWTYYCEHNEWIDIRLLHQREGGKSVVRPALEKLGGSIIFEQEYATTTHYQLTILGALLTKNGEQHEQLLTKYLGYLVRLTQQEPLRDYVCGQEIAAELKLTSEQNIVLGRLIHLGDIFSRSMGAYGTSEWDAGIPTDIEDLPTDLLTYIRTLAIEKYDEDVPLDTMERTNYYQHQTFLAWQSQNTKQLSKSPIEEAQEIVELKKRRLHELRKAEATRGISTDPSIIMEIEKLDAEIKNLENQ